MFELRLANQAEKFLDNIHKTNRKLFTHFIRSFDRLAVNPYIAKSLVGNLKGYYSHRVGDYRIIFEIDQGKSLIYVEKIIHRSIAYR